MQANIEFAVVSAFVTKSPDFGRTKGTVEVTGLHTAVRGWGRGWGEVDGGIPNLLFQLSRSGLC